MMELKASKNYNDLKGLYQNGFNWKVGTYTIKYKVYENSVSKPFEKIVSFKMTSLDINGLKTNIDKCSSEIDRNYIDSEIEYQTWNWANITTEE